MQLKNARLTHATLNSNIAILLTVQITAEDIAYNYVQLF